MWELIEIRGNSRMVINTFYSHTQAKNALWHAKKEAADDWLDLEYELQKVE